MTSRLTVTAGVLLLCLCAALAALIELSLVPLYVGGTIAPVSVPLALLGNAVLPRLARRLVDSPGAMALVVLCWLLPLVILALTPRPEGDVYVRANAGDQWVFYAVLFGGLAVGVATVVLTGTRPATRPGPRRPRPAQRSGSVR